MALIWTAWNSGTHLKSGAGYGFKVPIRDRDRFFDRKWRSVVLELPTASGHTEIEVNVAKDSFWTEKCHELISRDIGQWLRSNGLAPWRRGRPPKVNVEAVGERRFRVNGIAS
jgi:hypothetical protein